MGSVSWSRGYLPSCAAIGAFIIFAPWLKLKIAVPDPMWGFAVVALVLAAAMAILGLRRLSEQGVLTVIPSIGNAISGTFGAVLILGGLSFWFIYAVVTNQQITANEFSRGLITVTFTFGTMLTAFVVVLTALFGGTDRPTQSNDPQVIIAERAALRELLKARFDMGKEVLGLLIGIFGTILGFYFGSSSDDTLRRRTVSAIEALGGEVDGTTVRLMKTHAGDSHLSELRRLPKVEKVWLDYSWVTPEEIVYLYDLKDLQELHLTGTADPKTPVQALVKDLKAYFPNLKVYPDVAKIPSGVEKPHQDAAPQQGAAASTTNAPSKPPTPANDPNSVKPPAEDAPPAPSRPATKRATTDYHLEKQRVDPMIPLYTLSTDVVFADGVQPGSWSSTAPQARAVRCPKATDERWKLAQNHVILAQIGNPSHDELISARRQSEL